MTLDRVRAILARYEIAGPVPMSFTAEIDPYDPTGVAILATSTGHDADAWRDTRALVPFTSRHVSGVIAGATDADVHRVVARMVEAAYEHERAEWVLLDGRPVVDPHPEPARRPSAADAESENSSDSATDSGFGNRAWIRQPASAVPSAPEVEP